jgi:hypothetical protein
MREKTMMSTVNFDKSSSMKMRLTSNDLTYELSICGGGKRELPGSAFRFSAAYWDTLVKFIVINKGPEGETSAYNTIVHVYLLASFEVPLQVIFTWSWVGTSARVLSPNKASGLGLLVHLSLAAINILCVWSCICTRDIFATMDLERRPCSTWSTL